MRWRKRRWSCPVLLLVILLAMLRVHYVTIVSFIVGILCESELSSCGFSDLMKPFQVNLANATVIIRMSVTLPRFVIPSLSPFLPLYSLPFLLINCIGKVV